MDWRGWEASPVWSEIGGSSCEKTTVCGVVDCPALLDLFAAHLPDTTSGAPSKEKQISAFVLTDQGSDAQDSWITLRGTRGSGEGDTSATMHVQVPGYDVQCGCFHKVIVSANARGLILFAPLCVAVLAVPDRVASVAEHSLRAIPLVPPEGVEFLKALWHPISDLHVGLLLSDGTWQLLNLAQSAVVTNPEVHLNITFGGSGESVADFDFAAPSQTGSGDAGDAAWLAMTVVFLSVSGRMSVVSPVLPAVSVLPQAALDAMLEAGCDQTQSWLKKAVCEHQAVAFSSRGSFVNVRNPLNLHGHREEYCRRWRPFEQVLRERRDGDATPQRYCSVRLITHSPLVTIARATTSGTVEIVVVSGALAPKFDNKGSTLTCSVFEEIDLACGPSKSLVSLGPGSNVDMMIARTSTLVAAIEFTWLTSLISAVHPIDILPETTVTTLFDTDGGKLGGWQVLRHADGPARGFGLQVRAQTGGSGESNLVGVELGSRAKARPDRVTPSPSGQEVEYLAHLARPLLVPTCNVEEIASSVASTVASLQGGPVADLAARQVILRHLSTTSRSEGVVAELCELRETGDKLKEASLRSERQVNVIREQQKLLESQFSAIALALRSELEFQESDEVMTGELPRLWSQLHELRQAVKLLRVAAAGQTSAEPPEKLAVLGKLQATWTGAAQKQLWAHVHDADAVVRAATNLASERHLTG